MGTSISHSHPGLDHLKLADPQPKQIEQIENASMVGQLIDSIRETTERRIAEAEAAFAALERLKLAEWQWLTRQQAAWHKAIQTNDCNDRVEAEKAEAIWQELHSVLEP